MSIFNEEYENLLVQLLGMPTVNPFDMDKVDLTLINHRGALERIVQFAEEKGLKVEYLESPPKENYSQIEHNRKTIAAPKHVTKRFQERQEIRDHEANLVLRAGPMRDQERIICFNGHIDTVSGVPKPDFRDGVFYGRGAVDMKGPLTATLAGIVDAIQADFTLLNDISVRLQVVSGEEGGTLGIYGTADVVKRGYTGRLNVFCEPTSLGYFDSALTSMTPMITTSGNDAHDSTPQLGFVGRHILGYIDRYLERDFIPYVLANKGTICPAALQTEGSSHARVYGKAFVKWNIMYPSEGLGEEFKLRFEEEVQKAINAYKEEYKNNPLYRETAKAVNAKTAIEWLKSGFPVLNNKDPQLQKEVLYDVPNSSQLGVRPFCSDALWGPHYTIVCGPGDLGRNKAHADGENIELQHLEAHSQLVSRLIGRFRDYVVKQQKND